MNNEHYFSAAPTGEEHRRTINVQLAGKTYEVDTAGSIFSPDGVDRGTAILLDAVPMPPATGTFLDIGAGWGPVALTMGLRSPKAQVIAVEVNARAADLTRSNAKRLGLDNIIVQHPDQVSHDIGFDLIWANPPIRVGKQSLHKLLTKWLSRLNYGGQAWLVVAKQLGADSLLPWIDNMLYERYHGQFICRRADTKKGFRILHIARALQGSEESNK